MRLRTLFCLPALLLAGLPSAAADERLDRRLNRLNRLVKGLGHERFEHRELATQELVAMGEPVLVDVLQLAGKHPDLEVRHRARWIAGRIIQVARVSPSTGLQCVWIPAGAFLMGSPEKEPGRQTDELQHRVQITRSFLIGKYEVTQGEYEGVMASKPSWFRRGGEGDNRIASDTTRFPVEQVSWFDALEFCNRLSQRDGYPPYYRLEHVSLAGDSIAAATVSVRGGCGYRLPTEAEWEYACRSRTSGRYHFPSPSTKAANFVAQVRTGYGSRGTPSSLKRTVAVGSYPPNAWRLHDMHGNVAEWCWDCYDKDYYRDSPADDPRGPERGVHRALRGGSWLVAEASCRAASRGWLTPDERKYFAGFRVARSLATPPDRAASTNAAAPDGGDRTSEAAP